MTNIDRIRSMDEKELAKWLSGISVVATRMMSEPYLTATQQAAMHEQEYMHWMRWLQQPAKGDSDERTGRY